MCARVWFLLFFSCCMFRVACFVLHVVEIIWRLCDGLVRWLDCRDWFFRRCMRDGVGS
jgi:hypothetical protein